jgi:hypothetical protein
MSPELTNKEQRALYTSTLQTKKSQINISQTDRLQTNESRADVTQTDVSQTNESRTGESQTDKTQTYKPQPNNSHTGNPLDYEKTVYGYIPLMISANCIQKTQKSCYSSNSPKITKLLDRFGVAFLAVSLCDLCLNILYNSVPLYLPKEVASNDFLTKRLSFTIESEAQTLAILRYILNETPRQSVSNAAPCIPKHTTAHEYKPVD